MTRVNFKLAGSLYNPPCLQGSISAYSASILKIDDSERLLGRTGVRIYIAAL